MKKPGGLDLGIEGGGNEVLLTDDEYMKLVRIGEVATDQAVFFGDDKKMWASARIEDSFPGSFDGTVMTDGGVFLHGVRFVTIPAIINHGYPKIILIDGTTEEQVRELLEKIEV